MARSMALFLTAACLTLWTGCGATPHSIRSPRADREWIDNTSGVIDQLRRDLLLESTGGDTIGAARKTLRGGLYTVLVAYTDFGGCRHMVAAAGEAPERYADVTHRLSGACTLLQRAAALFTRAAKNDDAAALVRAGRLASSAAPLLVRAKIALQAAATSR